MNGESGGSWAARRVSCPGGWGRRGGAGAGKGFWEPRGPPRSIVRTENQSKQNELHLVRGESQTEGAQRLNGGQLHLPLPPRLWERAGRGTAAPLSPRSPTPPSTPNLSVQTRGSGNLGRVPGP